MQVPQFRRQGMFYKYRSLDNFERFISIIIDKKLYGALYSEMNDPMEGYFTYSKNGNFMRRLVEGKNGTYICSLSRSGNIGLMWTHYANENRGCCIEVEVTSETWEEVEVRYSREMPEVTINSSVRDILEVKSEIWNYEQETRFLSPETPKGTKRPRLTVRISRVFIGFNVERSVASHLVTIIKALDPKIEVIKMHRDWLDYGYK